MAKKTGKKPKKKKALPFYPPALIPVVCGEDDQPLPRGRPTLYSQELAEYICKELSCGRTLVSICRQDNMPQYPTVMDWLWEKKATYNANFAEMYALARDRQADYWADEIADISDDGSNDWYTHEKFGRMLDHEHVQRSKLRVDARKWIASKLKPRKYGDKLIHATAEELPAEIVVEYGGKPTNEE